MNTYMYLIPIGIGVLSCILLYPLCLKLVFFILLLVLSLLLGVIIASWINLVLSSPHRSTVGAENTLKQLEYFRNRLMKDYDSYTLAKPTAQFATIFGRTVDSLLQQLLDFILRDYISIYLKEYAYDYETLEYTIKEDMWGAIQILHDRFSRIDQAKLIAVDIVMKLTEHFEKIREAKIQMIENDKPPMFHVSHHVISEKKEFEYLRNMSELFIMFLLPRTYSLSPTKHFLREILTCKVIKPFIENVTDPDFFNRNVILYIQSQEHESRIHVKGIENANTFEDVIKIIHSTNDIESLKSLRYNIVTKLMQATTLQNLNRAKGVDLDNDKNTLSSAGIQKSDINAAKKLRKYINQLTYAKKECEKKLSALGWDLGYQFADEKILPLSTIMDHILGRKYLTQFLETLASQDLVRYWISVEELRTAQRKNWHQLGAEIFYTFIRNPTSEIKVDKNTRKRMEAFLLGDKGPDVFYEVQCQVLQTIEDKYYQPFLISDYYKEMVISMEKEEDDISENESRKSLDERNIMTDSGGSVDSGLNVGDHSNYARRKLDQLQEKLINKSQALSALKTSLRPESKILSKLEQEVEWLQGEQRQLEAHLNRTEVWGENLGKWRANVQNAEIPDEKEPPQFVLVVHMENEQEDDDCISTGWVVCRSLGQFQELHKKLRPMCADIRNLELPSNTFKFLFGKIDRTTLDRAKQQIQRYLDFVLKDDRLNQSEAIYSFLSPSSEHLKQSSPNPKKSRFFFSTLFKSGSEQSKDSFSILREVEDEDISQSLDSSSTDTVDFVKSNGNYNRIFDDTKDTIAEPLYALLSELFDMKGFFKYIRKTLIGFVQVTYGRNINKQIHETINWVFSEHMLHYYITLILKSYWPGGTLAEAVPKRTDEEKLHAAKRAQDLFVNNVPELLTTLVGNNAAKNGARKLFEAMQEKDMNKHLFYEIFEVVMDSIFPELN